MRKELIVVNNFLTNPDEARAWGLDQKFYTSDAHKGHRTQSTAHGGDYYEHQKGEERWADILGCTTLKPAGAYGEFTYMKASDPVVYHQDPFDWGCVIYLNPDAPLTAGTSIWRPHNESNPFQGGFFDRTKFDLIDQIGNVYNRAVFWRGTNTHSATEYFGVDKETARLTQHYFWNE